MEKITTSRVIKNNNVILQQIFQITSDVSGYNHPVYKLMTNKLQVELINVLIRSILTLKFYKVVSVSMHLRCDGIFTDQFITQSLLSKRLKIV